MRFTRPLLMSIWKNWILHKRFFIVTGIEILLPLCISFLMVYLATEIRPIMVNRGITENGNSTYKRRDVLNGTWNNYVILFAPNNTRTWDLMNSSFGNIKEVEFIGFNSEHEIIEEAEKYRRMTRKYFWGAVIFSEASVTSSPPVLKYKMRPSDYSDLGKSYYSGRISDRLGDNDYYHFLSAQMLINLGYIKLHQEEMQEDAQNYKIFTERMPYPPYKSINSSVAPAYIIPMIVCSGFVILCLIIVKRVVDEKNNRAKEMMKMMGMSTPAYWGGVFISNFLLMVIINVLITVLYVIPFKPGISVLQDTSFTLFFVILMLYCMSSLLFCCVISTLFTKAALAITVTLVLWIVTLVVPYIIISSENISYSYVGKVFSCLLPNMAFVLACNIMSINDVSGKSAAWSNIMEPAFGSHDSFCLGTVMGMMILSVVLYTLLLFYLDSVWPWQPGLPKSPLFCFYPSFWFQSKNKVEEENNFDTTRKSSYFEDEPVHSAPSVIISHLSKAFTVENVDKLAVDDLSLNMYPGQITALLGHNGAGKTTTMNILTGIFPPTKGTAIINGHDIITDTDAARSNLGLCPQHNVLYDTLTVEEHLKFFAGLKGKSWSAMNEEIPKLIEDLGLQDKRYTLAKDLSGGMKRKLSLGNAIAGESQVLILDEPTTGLDPEARRVIWDVLEKLRPGRTILLTTHYMEEADTLGDRIAIMASGTVQCCGSAMFLKRKFGTGYHLRIEKGKNCQVNEITNVVQRYVPEANLINNVSLELMYSLSNSPQQFSDLFQELENSYDKLGIASCGVTITTMDDVFLKVGQMIEEQDKTEEQPPVVITNGRGTTLKHHTGKRASKLFQQMKALFKKRINYAKRHILLLIFQVVLPMLAICLYLFISFSPADNSGTGKMNLDLDALFTRKKYGVYHYVQNTSKVMSLVRIYENRLKEESVKVEEIAPSEDPVKYLIDRGIKGIDSYTTGYLVGGSVENEGNDWNVTAWYNGIQYNLAPISVNLMTTSLLRYTTKSDEGKIDITIEPLTTGNRYVDYGEMDMGRIFNAAFLPLGLTFLSSSFVLLPIHERVSKAKLLQTMCGVHPVMYWLMHLAWDFLAHTCSSILLLIPFLIYHGQNGFIATEAVGAIFFCLLLFGLSSTTLSYLVSFIPKIPSTGFSILTILNATSGIIITFVMLFLNYVIIPSPPKVKTAMWFMRLFPNFAVTWGINNIHRLSQNNINCHNFLGDNPVENCKATTVRRWRCCTNQVLEGKGYHSSSYLSWEQGAGKDCLYLFLTFILWSGIIMMIETVLPKMCHYAIQRIKRQRRGAVNEALTLTTTSLNEDSDVANERQRTEDLFFRNAMNEEALLVTRLSKMFKSLCAVNNLTFGVHKEECFGLLGINGAGKTTTFRMLTGDLLPTVGDAYIDYFSIQNNLRKFQILVGYCPQFDALIDRLTGREMLQLFASLRGIPENEINLTVNEMISSCDLDANADKQTRTYSGGTKRKLSLAIALIGAPPVVLLDEPTAGVDPASRRKIWKTLSAMKQMLGVSYILTSHSMDECESLCNRIAIMVNGEFRCLGAMQSLKTKFGQGYSIAIKLKQADFQDLNKRLEVKAYIEQIFPSASLKVEYQGNLHYHITDTSVKWSTMFSTMEEAKETFQLEDYVLSGTTLEQIFLAFARAQTGLV